MLSAICFSSDQSEILLSGNGSKLMALSCTVVSVLDQSTEGAWFESPVLGISFRDLMITVREILPLSLLFISFVIVKRESTQWLLKG